MEIKNRLLPLKSTLLATTEGDEVCALITSKGALAAQNWRTLTGSSPPELGERGTKSYWIPQRQQGDVVCTEEFMRACVPDAKAK